MFTEKQQWLIDYCKEAGHGWEQFARSVEERGSCTQPQHKTLLSMHHRISGHRSDVTHYKANARSSYEPDISDCEAMKSGDYF